MVNHDMPVTKLMELMGHQSLSTPMGYYKLDEAKLAASFHAAMEHIR
jgi:site-specific recombinase XerC